MASPGSRSVNDGWPCQSSDLWRGWLGEIESLPQAVLTAANENKLASIILSHRTHHPEWSATRRAAIEETLQIFRRDGLVLLVSPETPLGAFLICLAQRMRVAFEAIATPDSHRRARGELPWIDRALVALPRRVFVMDVAAGSKSFALIERRLHDSRFPAASIFVDIDCGMHCDPATSTSFVSPSGTRSGLLKGVRDALVEMGAVLQLRASAFENPPMASSCFEEVVLGDESHPLPAWKLVPVFHRHLLADLRGDAWRYLTHCTRGRAGPWPDQSDQGYWSSLMVANEASQANGSPLTTLKRIIAQQRLLATTFLKRSSVPTVSFSEVPLQDLLRRRRFRSHLGRWDWEPYGLCVRREWIRRLGGRPVVYGDAQVANGLAPEEKVFFQLQANSEVDGAIDRGASRWQEEKELRLPCDLRFSELPFDAAFHFVPTYREAKELQPLSRFPILFLE